jgi:hypothetical protein
MAFMPLIGRFWVNGRASPAQWKSGVPEYHPEFPDQFVMFGMLPFFLAVRKRRAGGCWLSSLSLRDLDHAADLPSSPSRNPAMSNA